MIEERSMKKFVCKGVGVLLIAVFTLLFASSATIAYSKEVGGLKWTATGEVESCYSTNIYNLSSAQIDRLEADKASDAISGRYDDMDSVTDLIIAPSIEFEGKRKGLFGKTFRLTPALTYKKYLFNSKKSHPEVELDIEQGLPVGGTIALELAYKHGVFSKNSLSGAIDTSGDGTISSSERIYSAIKYNSFVYDVVYNRTLWKIKKGSRAPLGMTRVKGEFLLGKEKKVYDSPFANRDKDTLRLGTSVDIELNKKASFELAYMYEKVDIPVATEVLLRDEDDFNEDLNTDADFTDQNVRVEKPVDRSRTEQSLSAELTMELDKTWTGHASYGLRLQNYESSERYDITRTGRKDRRHKFGAGAERDFGKKVSLELDWTYTTEEASRVGLETLDEDEQKSYNKHMFSAVVSYKF